MTASASRSSFSVLAHNSPAGRERPRNPPMLKGRAAGVFAEAKMHTPTDITERAMETVRARGADGLVAVGGGSAVGLSKAICAVRTGLPQVVAPTTYAGSEVTTVLGETKDGVKTTPLAPFSRRRSSTTSTSR